MNFQNKIAALRAHHEELLNRINVPNAWGNGINHAAFLHAFF